ncbi:GGDEF domain-containing protein [Sulfuriferula sp. AH1]|uniref:GGDEF domain-containing protein n=1 Tax=Sulfuriferula sp. AH1 TaxID=1985873 RepID=UPI001672C133|nr:GGDEF domain-containing protein [Sulfuriferula sp. AH1]
MKDADLDIGNARELLTKLLSQYEKLLRETQQLIKLSDRKARELHLLNQKLKQLSKDFEFQSQHDALTGLYNKGEITRIIQEQLSLHDFILILFDIDYFKKVNDSYGHIVGDQVLKLIANLVEQNTKHKDYIGRFGGEEFVLILNDTTLEQSIETADKLRRLIGDSILDADGIQVSVTVSMGLTLCRQHELFEDVYIRVDQLLYAAKKAGRNRVEAMPAR